MGRRRRTSPAEDIISLVALVPWWGGVAVGLEAYLYFHSVASGPAPVMVPPGKPGHSVLPTVWYGLTQVLQYIVPILCFAGAAVSAVRRRSSPDGQATMATRSAPPTSDRSNATVSGRARPSPAAAASENTIKRAGAEASPPCPKCSKPMVRRVARQGAAAGNAFWGCTDYPGCRGTRQIET